MTASRATPGAFDDLLAANQLYSTARGPLVAPDEILARPVVLTCIDARIDPIAALGLPLGHAQVYRNPGGLATREALTALAFSIHYFGTARIVVMHHTDCGLTKVTTEGARSHIGAASGADASSLEIVGVTDPDACLREDVELVRRSPFVPADVPVIGLMYDVDSGAVTPLA